VLPPALQRGEKVHHRNGVGAVERAERPPIVAADKLARALGTTLSGMFSELERSSDGPYAP
jgi:hypothetical protein